MRVKTVSVKMWGTVIGYLHQEENGLVGFQYDKPDYRNIIFEELKRNYNKSK